MGHGINKCHGADIGHGIDVGHSIDRYHGIGIDHGIDICHGIGLDVVDVGCQGCTKRRQIQAICQKRRNWI